jgi:hypothetical protein
MKRAFVALFVFSPGVLEGENPVRRVQLAAKAAEQTSAYRKL